jgi:quercetin dioxygenase-like cupin family protein
MKINRGREAGSPSEQRTATFTGTVWADPVLSGAEGVNVVAVTFQPAARTHWHRHEAGQILFVTHGRGYVQTRGGEGAWVAAGDVVHFPAGEEHWHGAGPDTYLVHTAVSLGQTEWLTEVTDDEYGTAFG